jgi:hypothetical protein
MQGNQPLHVLKSYLEACEVHFETKGDKLEISKKDGGILSIDVNSIGNEIISPVAKVFLAALHSITEAAGYGSPIPVDRGEAPTSRINYKEHFEQVYLRHSVFRRSPNPKDLQALDKYNKTIEGTANRAYKRYHWILQPMGFGAEDLVSIGKVHTIAFIHYYAAAINNVDNIKLLTEYLKQRFSELAHLCHKKAANSTCLPSNVKNLPVNEEDSFDHYLNIMGDANAVEEDEEYVEGLYRLIAVDNSEIPVEIKRAGLMGLDIYVNRHKLTASEVDNFKQKLADGLFKLVPVEIAEKVSDIKSKLNNGMSEYQRRTKARELLFNGLDKLTPEERNIALAYAVYSRDYEPDARIMAKKLCEELHCPKCQRKVATGNFCRKCSVEATPRYGVNYKEIKERLSPRVVCVKCNVNKCSCIEGAKIITVGNKPFVIKVKPKTTVIYPEGSYLTESMTSIPAETQKPQTVTVENTIPVKVKVTMAPAEEIKSAEKKMVQEFWETLPEEMHCPKHNNGTGGLAPKSTFRPLVASRFDNGMPKRIRHTSYCVPCFKAYSKKS